MKKISILTFSRAHNHGAILQAYALQNTIEKMGNSVEIIDFRDERIENPYYPIYLKNKSLKKKIKEITKFVFYFSKKNKRFETFNKFIEDKLNLSKIKYTYKNIEKIDTDIIITGSDQVWNKDIVGDLFDIYTLNFKCKDCIKKMSYAASIGNVKKISKYEQLYKNNISLLEYVSVRENDAKESMQSLINNDIEVVLDPTLLMCKDDWDNFIKTEKCNDQNYILAYVIAPNKEYVKIVNDLSRRTGLKVVHFGLVNPGYTNVLKSLYTEGPDKFVSYIKNAEYVVATSFHATVFSIIYNKRFFIVPHKETGTRVTSLLKTLGIEGRTFSSYEEFKNIDYSFETDWKCVEKNLDEERKKSIRWLKNAIEGE